MPNNDGETVDPVVLNESAGLSTRRSFLKKAAAGGAVLGAMYAAPQFSSVTARPAYASITGAKSGPFVMYGIGHTGDKVSRLFTIDPTDGSSTLVGVVSGDLSNSMAVRPSDCAIFVSTGATTLFRINPCTGAATSVGDTGINLFSMAFSPGGTLYGIEHSSGVAALYIIDDSDGSISFVTNLVYPAGSTVFPVSALDFRSDGTLFGGFRNGGGLVTIDPVSGVITIVGTITPDFGTRASIAFDQSGQLYGSGFSPNNIAKINDSTAAATDITAVSPIILGLGFAPAC